MHCGDVDDAVRCKVNFNFAAKDKFKEQCDDSWLAGSSHPSSEQTYSRKEILDDRQIGKRLPKQKVSNEVYSSSK